MACRAVGVFSPFAITLGSCRDLYAIIIQYNLLLVDVCGLIFRFGSCLGP